LNAPSGPRGFRFRAEWPALAAIAGVFALGWLLISPWRNVPIIDDWVYAWSVQHLLKTGELRISDYSSVYPIAQILWGTLFARLTGFSFGILRLSTAVLAVCGCCAIYLTLRELSVTAVASLLAALTVALHPVYFSLAFTFMTDVPFVSLSSIALFFYVSASVRNRPKRLWWGSGVALLAFLVRPLGLVLPLSVVAGIRLREWRTMGRTILPLATIVLAMAMLWFAMPRVFGHLPVADQRVQGLSYVSLVPLRKYADWDLNLAFITAFPFAPLLLALLARPKRAVAIGVVAMALMIGLRLVLGELPTPLPDWQTWSLQDLATRGGLFGGDLKPSAWSVRVTPILRVVGAVLVSSLCVGLIVSRPQRPSAARILLAVGLAHVVLLNVLWFFNDRYYLVLVSSLAYFAAAPLTGERRDVCVAAPVLALWGFFSITGTRDMLATNEVAARIARGLEESGVPPSEVDAGYALNGWRLYAHPENLPPKADRHEDVPFITSDAPTQYRIVNVPGPDEEVIRVEPLPDAWWQVTDRVYLVRRRTAR
jgi:hypothetical protein